MFGWTFFHFVFQVPGSRPNSASQPRPKPVYGRKQFSNAGNNPSAGAPKAMFGSYTQNVGTISSSALAAIRKSWGLLSNQVDISCELIGNRKPVPGEMENSNGSVQTGWSNPWQRTGPSCTVVFHVMFVCLLSKTGFIKIQHFRSWKNWVTDWT